MKFIKPKSHLLTCLVSRGEKNKLHRVEIVLENLQFGVLAIRLGTLRSYYLLGVRNGLVSYLKVNQK